MSWGYPIYHQCDFGIFHEIKTIQLLGYLIFLGNLQSQMVKQQFTNGKPASHRGFLLATPMGLVVVHHHS